MNKSLGKWPHFSQEEIKKVASILSSGKVNYWTGDNCKSFEKEFSEYTDTKYAITLANGTLALELALIALEIRKGDEVIVTPRSFIASASSIIAAGAKPVFADIDLNSGNIDPSSIEKKITNKTKAIICVHLAGWPCEMDHIMKIAKKNKIYVIEDCAQAHGAKYHGKSVGSIGHIGAWSFCQDKIMSTGGEGGMVTTNNRSLWKKMWEYKDHGKSEKKVSNPPSKPGFRWLHDSFGSNYRMTEMQAAIGRIQLGKMDRWTKERNNNAEKLKKVCDKFPKLLRTPVCSTTSHNAYYKFYTYLNEKGLKKGWGRTKLISEIVARGVPCFEGSCSEMYLEKAFQSNSYQPKSRLKNAKELGDTSIMFLVHPTLTKSDVLLISNVMEEIFSKASK